MYTFVIAVRRKEEIVKINTVKARHPYYALRMIREMWDVMNPTDTDDVELEILRSNFRA